MVPTDAQDRSLIASIAERRDREAFSELFARFKNPAHSLARYITRDTSLAEEAVQEAFLHIWRSAHTFKSAGRPRSWILRIVAQRCFEILRSKRRSHRKMERAQQLAMQAECSKQAGAEQDELLEVLRRQLEGLPELERNLIALYYGCELTQDEISEQLHLPQTTVSLRIQNALGQLRKNLVAGGFAGMLPLAGGGLGIEVLGKALCTGSESPPGMGRAIMARLGESAFEASRRMALAKNMLSPLLWGAGIVMLTAAVTVAYVWTKAVDSPHSAELKRPDAIAKPGVARMPEPGQELFGAQWSFKDGPPSDLPAIQGQWTWQMGPDGIGEMGIAPRSSGDDTRRDIILVFPSRVPARPVRLAMKVRASRTEALGINLLWLSKDGLAPLVHHSTMLLIRRKLNDLKVYIFDKWMIYFLNDRVFAVSQYEQSYPAGRLAFIVTNYHVREIEIREMAQDDPELLALDATALIEELRKDKASYVRKAIPLRPIDQAKVPEADR